MAELPDYLVISNRKMFLTKTSTAKMIDIFGTKKDIEVGDVIENYNLVSVMYIPPGENYYTDDYIFYFKKKPDSAEAGGGSRKSRRKAHKSRRSKAKKSRRRTRK